MEKRILDEDLALFEREYVSKMAVDEEMRPAFKRKKIHLRPGNRGECLLEHQRKAHRSIWELNRMIESWALRIIGLR